MNEYAEKAWNEFKLTPHRKDDRYHAFMAGWTAGIDTAIARAKAEHLAFQARRLPDMSMPDVPQFRSVHPKTLQR